MVLPNAEDVTVAGELANIEVVDGAAEPVVDAVPNAAVANILAPDDAGGLVEDVDVAFVSGLHMVRPCKRLSVAAFSELQI